MLLLRCNRRGQAKSPFPSRNIDPIPARRKRAGAPCSKTAGGGEPVNVSKLRGKIILHIPRVILYAYSAPYPRAKSAFSFSNFPDRRAKRMLERKWRRCRRDFPAAPWAASRAEPKLTPWSIQLPHDFHERRDRLQVPLLQGYIRTAQPSIKPHGDACQRRACALVLETVWVHWAGRSRSANLYTVYRTFSFPATICFLAWRNWPARSARERPSGGSRPFRGGLVDEAIWSGRALTSFALWTPSGSLTRTGLNRVGWRANWKKL